jgi:hypothetical protein
MSVHNYLVFVWGGESLFAHRNSDIKDLSAEGFTLLMFLEFPAKLL